MKTYWVEYTYTYEMFIDEEWETENDFDAGRFTCKKADIQKEVKNQIKDDYAISPTYEEACEAAIKYCLENLI